ncbi:phosphate ABC transporter substrate-binding protein [Thalassolituus sp. LLYu03]|uniref:phosphate ABC transporter substrate-binding protein n=1 Tax=Thalassolituus sp. LLYu03 TaxID=3421656 RepID=UPI003D26FE86
MKMSKVISRIAIAASLLLGAAANAEIAVIVAAGNANGALDQDTISRIFLGKTANFPDGSQAIPIDQNEGSAVRESFNDKVLGKSSSQLKAYWSRLIFTGKGTPPKESGADADIKALVAKNPNLVGYVDASAVDASVKVVFKF